MRDAQPIARPHDPISPEEAVRLLLHAGLLSSRDIVTSDVRVEPIAARNRSLRVVNPAGRGLFLKQAEPSDPSAAATLAREAAFYEAVRAPSFPAAVRDRVPALVSWDVARALLILELVPDACNAHELDDADGPTQFPRIGALLGEALAAFHGIHPPAAGSHGGSEVSAMNPSVPPLEEVPAPWILDVCRPDPGVLRDVSPAQLEVTRQAQASPGVDEALTALRARWAPKALVHGDLKWGNVLVRARAPHFEPEQVWIVDWEYGGWGDAMWDLGSALHAFVADCVHAAIADEDATPMQVRTTFDQSLVRARVQMRAMWDSYRDAGARSGANASQDVRDAAVRAAGARLLQSAWEWCHGQWQPPRDAVLALQLAMNLLRAPLPDAIAYLGLVQDHAAA